MKELDTCKYLLYIYRNSVYTEHRKDLSKNMDVVCFAMAVEIDRLL